MARIGMSFLLLGTIGMIGSVLFGWGLWGLLASVAAIIIAGTLVLRK